MKLGFVAAGSAFILSLLLGFVSGAGFLAVLLRAVFFASLFLGLAFGARLLISRFLPELLGLPEEEGPESEAETGSRIDMVVGDEEPGRMPGEEAIARGRPRTSVDDEAAEEIEAFLPENGLTPERPVAAESAGLDLGSEGRYTEESGKANVPLGQSKGRSAEPALPPGLLDDVDVLPDLDSMSDSFVSPLVEEATERSSGESSASRSFSAPRSSESGGDFDPREMAAAIQTILKRDQKG